jgi:peroxiredoxin
MYRRLISISFIVQLSFLMGAHAQYKYSGNFIINGNISQIAKNGTVYLEYSNNYAQKRDSAKIRNGLFVLKGRIDEPKKCLMYLRERGGKSNSDNLFQFYLQPSVCRLMAKKRLCDATIKGSQVNDDKLLYESMTKKLYDVLGDLYPKYYQVLNKDKAEEHNLSIKVDSVANLIAQRQEEFVKSHPGSPYSLDVLWLYFNLPTAKATKVHSFYDYIDPRVKALDFGKQLGERHAAIVNSELGKTAKNFTLARDDGSMFSLSDLKGKYVYIDFWASYCPSCIRQLPFIRSLYDKYKNKNLVVLLISVDPLTNKEEWLKAIQKYQVGSFINLVDFDRKVTGSLFDIPSIPVNYLIDSDGKIIGHNLSHFCLEDILETIPNK